MKRFTPYEQWHSPSLENGAFSHLNTLFSLNGLSDWPQCAWFSSFLDAKNANQQTIRFVDDA